MKDCESDRLKYGGAARPLPRDGSVEELRWDPTIWPHPKVWTRGRRWQWKKWCQRWRAGEAQMQDNSEGSELDPADDVRRRCKKNSPSVLSCKVI